MKAVAAFVLAAVFAAGVAVGVALSDDERTKAALLLDACMLSFAESLARCECWGGE